MGPLAGIELATLRIPVQCSNQLATELYRVEKKVDNFKMVRNFPI